MECANDETELEDMVYSHLLDDTFFVRSAPSPIWQRVARVIPIALAICVINLITFFLSRNYYNIDSSYCLLWQGGSHSFLCRRIWYLPMLTEDSFNETGSLLDRLTVPVFQTQRDDTLLLDTSIPRHIYRQLPSPEVDAAWRALSHGGIIAVGKEEVMRAGKDPETLVKVPKDWGYGPDKYTAIVDGMHQVHCFDLLRKNLITNYEYYYGNHYNFTPPIFLEVHVNHCLDSLLQDLMCNANEHITFFDWVEGQDGAQPDFAVNRVCCDYQALVDWFDDNMIQDWEHKVQQLHWQPGDKKHPRFDGWKEYTSRKFTGYQGGTPLGALENLPPSCTAK